MLVVPSSAGFRDRGAWAVEIARGLAPGDQVVLHPSDRIHDGARVEAR